MIHSTKFLCLEEARTFKANFERVKIKGIKQLKPKYDVEIKVPKAHIRSRPNGSIIGRANNFNSFEHVKDVDEWYKINYKGQFGFTHKNNAKIKIEDAKYSISMGVSYFMFKTLSKKVTIRTIIITFIILFFNSSRFFISRIVIVLFLLATSISEINNS